MPGHNPNIFMPGHVGVISRSGSLGTLMCLNLTRASLGQSAFIGIGGDPIIGTTTRDALEALDRDDRTKAVVLVGEIGGAMEEEAAEYARGDEETRCFLHRRTLVPAGQEDGPRRSDRDRRPRRLRFEARGARKSRRQGRGYAGRDRRLSLAGAGRLILAPPVNSRKNSFVTGKADDESQNSPALKAGF